MARIRSIHPGIWTDEGFMGLSAYARLLFFGLWNEAWDDGVFEWKPLTIKARIFPVDSVDVVELLGELSDSGFIVQVQQPKSIGLIRNFQKFQRPKKPNSSQLLPEEWLEFVGAKTDSSELVENQSPTVTEKSPQMEDGGCSGRDATASKTRERVRLVDEFEKWYAHYPHKVQRGQAEKAFPKARKLASLQELIDGVKRYVDSKPPDRPFQNPATWLNGKGWMDAPAMVQPRASPTPRSERIDHFKEFAERISGQTGNSTGERGDWVDAESVPVLTIEHQR